MGIVISGIQQIGIGIPNVQEAFDWYRKHFGMDIKVFEEAAEAVAEEAAEVVAEEAVEEVVEAVAEETPEVVEEATEEAPAEEAKKEEE